MTGMIKKRIQTGADPRTLTDYAALRDEINKLCHPARPDVDWRYAEKLCLSLFDQNGAELQTAAWYTLARTHTGGISGLNEGLSILQGLILYQWSVLWPQAMQARAEIISTLSKRLQGILRSWSFHSNNLLPELNQAEQLLLSVRDALTGYGMRDAGQFGLLYQQLNYSLTRLQESTASSIAAAIDSPVKAAHPSCVIYSRPEVPLKIGTPSVVKPFILGACCALLVGTLAASGGVYWRHHQLQQQSLVQEKLEQQRIAREAMPVDRLSGWHHGMAQLQQLADRLDSLDEKRGKYLTVSELKSSVFSVMQTFNQTIPLEEHLRRLASGTGNQTAEQAQTAMLIKQLEDRYKLLMQGKDITVASVAAAEGD